MNDIAISPELKALGAEIANQLAAALKTSKEPQPLWDVNDIARYLKISPDSVTKRVASRADFPGAVSPTGAASLRWFAADIEKWARQNTAKIPRGRPGRSRND